MKFLNCQNCTKKLLKIGKFDHLSIKCPRCKTINYLSVQNATPEDHESQTKEGSTRGHNQVKDPQSRFKSTS
ncbi:Com family DNA-binding transcriptional regulator [Psychrobacter aquaticus]